MTAHDLLNQRFSNGVIIEIHSGDTLDIIEIMIEFAKYHVEQALKEASIKATAYNKAKFKGDINSQVDMDSILNAYPLDNIV